MIIKKIITIFSHITYVLQRVIRIVTYYNVLQRITYYKYYDVYIFHVTRLLHLVH